MEWIKKNWTLLATGVICVVCLVIFRVRWDWAPLVIGKNISDVASLLAPLAFCAAVVERAVEIIISPWRDTGATHLQNEITAIQARPADATKAADLKVATDKLNAYRGETQKLAFLVSVLLSFLVAMAGIRAIGPFLDADKFNALKTSVPGQWLFFLTVDVVLSAALLAGGADGIHTIVTSVTDFLNNKSSDKTNPANQ